MRRSLPFEKPDLILLLEWCNGGEILSRYFGPIGPITRALERYAAETPIDPELRQAMTQFAARLRSSYHKDIKRLATAVEQLCANAGAEPPGEAAPEVDAQPAPTPAPAGLPGVLEALKRFRGMTTDDAEAPATVIEPDRFPLRDDSPLRHEHELLSALFESVVGTPGYSNPDLQGLKSGQVLLALKPAALGRAVLAAAERHINTLLTPSALSVSVAFGNRATPRPRPWPR